MSISTRTYNSDRVDTFYTSDELLSHPNFNNIRRLDIRLLIDLKTFPCNLEVLCYDNLKIKSLPQLPLSLKKLSVRSCRIEKLPDFSLFTQIEELDLYDNFLTELTSLPPNVRTVITNMGSIGIFSQSSNNFVADFSQLF